MNKNLIDLQDFIVEPFYINFKINFKQKLIRNAIKKLGDLNKGIISKETFWFASNVDSLSIGASGDSGGPIISDNGQKKIQVGIMHALNTNNYTVTVNNFIKVSYYSSWITRTTGIQPESGSWNGTLLPSTTRRTTTPSPTIPIPTPKEKPFCSGINRFCASLNKCEDYYDLTYGKKYFHENKNYKCYGNNKCCERNYITPSIKH